MQHPDQFYRAGSAVSSGCHDIKPKPKKGNRAGVWGTHHSYGLYFHQTIHAPDIVPYQETVIRPCGYII